MAYGATNEVAALTPRYAGQGGDFTASTRPSVSQVSTWLTQVSGLIDTQLEARRYSTPVTATDMNAALDMFTNDKAALMVEAVNGTGRYGPQSNNAPRGSWYDDLLVDIPMFLDLIAAGEAVTAVSVPVTREDGFS